MAEEISQNLMTLLAWLYPSTVPFITSIVWRATQNASFTFSCFPDAAARYFKWSRGAQLRGNLDALETWATGNNLQQEATGYLRKVNCLADLLATPKVQLLQVSTQLN